jgi:asparagine synthase (glutamine-hydrolysing)
MRSFVGILSGDETPPDAQLLRHLATKLRLPASSEPALALDDGCGLATVTHRENTATPVARSGSVSLAGDLRIDGAGDDDQRVLDAWERWRERCVEHLQGDYAFAIWDAAAGELFCARDRFGVRPLYYARIDTGLVFSDSLEAVLAHPGVPFEDLDEGAVADYLVSGTPEESEATIYAHVRRLAPAHMLTLRRGATPNVRRYWTLQPVAKETPRDAPARLEAALKAAVADRVRAPSAVVFMSGGLDSTALAAIAREVRPRTRLLALTSVYRSRIADVEEPYAVEAARSIGIESRCFPLDGYPPLHALGAGVWTPEPGPLLTATMTRDIYAAAAEHAPVALHGHPADAVMAAEPVPFLRALLRGGRIGALVTALAQHTAITRRPPWFFLRDLLGMPRSGDAPAPPPPWLRAPLTERLRSRTPIHSDAPLAIRALASSDWSSYFEWAHPLRTRAPIELVYPWCDLRVIEAVLALEPIPWLVRKHVLRELLRGRVSEAIRTREKTFMQGDPWTAAWPPAGNAEIDRASRYIDPGRFREAGREAGVIRDAALRALALEYWLGELQANVARLRSRLMV